MNRRASRRIQDFGDREMGGMMISRRPNRRASSEYAPGPVREMAALIMITKKIANLSSNKIAVGAGSQDRATPALHMPDRMLARRVRNPVSNETPQAIANRLTIHAPSLRLAPSTR